MLELVEGRLMLHDTGSKFGTFLNDQRLSPSLVASVAQEVHDGDVLRLGETLAGGGGAVGQEAVVVRVFLHTASVLRVTAAHLYELPNVVHPSSSSPVRWVGLDYVFCLYHVCLVEVRVRSSPS